MKPETIKRRLERVETAIQYRTFNRAYIYTVFFCPGKKVVAATLYDEDARAYEKKHNAVSFDLLIHIPEPRERKFPPAEMDITDEYKENYYEQYERGLRKWRDLKSKKCATRSR